VKLFIVQSFPFSSYFVSPRHKYLPQHPILSLCFFLNVKDRVLHPYKSAGKMKVLYIGSNVKDKIWQHTLPQFNLLLISSLMQFWFPGFPPPVSTDLLPLLFCETVLFAVYET
jgi:hypothetical protein